MLDIGWSELFIVAIIALLVVGPKELPSLLRTIGRFMAMIKRQAQEFRTQFDEAIKDSEFEQVKKDFEDLKSDAESTIRDAGAGFEDEMRELDDIGREVDRDIKTSMEDDTGKADVAALDEPDDWRDRHNAGVLEMEKNSTGNGNASPPAEGSDIVDDGAADETEQTDTDRQSAKAGAAT